MSLALLVALVAALAMWMRSRSRPIQVDDPPEWPPLPPLHDGAAGTETIATSGDGADTVAEVSSDEPGPVDAGSGEAAWRLCGDDGACPDGYPIKAKESSGIFHVPGGRFYDRTTPDRCYPDAASAIADGYRQAKT